MKTESVSIKRRRTNNPFGTKGQTVEKVRRKPGFFAIMWYNIVGDENAGRKENGEHRNDGEIVSLNELVPKFHLLRKIDRAIDWTKIYPTVESKYSKIGRPRQRAIRIISYWM